MIETFKRKDGEGLGANKVGEGSGENIPEPPKIHHKNDFPPKPNHLRNRLDTTLAPPVFPPQTNDFQKPIKFVSTSGKVFFGKQSEKTSEEKPVEKSSGEKPSEQPQSKPKTKLVRFHCGYCGRDGRNDEFCFTRKREERMAKEWANKDKYHPSDGVLEPRVHMPRAKASVRTVTAWGERKAVGGATGRATPVRPMRGIGQTSEGLDRQQFGFHARISARIGSGGRGSGGWAREFAGGQFDRRSPPRAQCGDGRIRSFEMERRDGPRAFIHGFGPPSGGEGWFPHSGYRGSVRGGRFGRKITPLSSKWLGTGFNLLALTPVLSRLFAHVLVFEFQVGDLKNIWLIDSGCSRHMTGDKRWFSSLIPLVTKMYITFGDNGRERVLSEGEINVTDKITLRRVALVQSLGYYLLSVSQLLD
jgi:hypothetical protein